MKMTWEMLRAQAKQDLQAGKLPPVSGCFELVRDPGVNMWVFIKLILHNRATWP